jgi:hypothetical protein
MFLNIVDLDSFLNSALNFINKGYADKVLDQCQKLPNASELII